MSDAMFYLDTLVALRWVALGLAVVGLAWAAFNVLARPEPVVSTHVVFDIYPGGTPVRSDAEIVDIVRTALAREGADFITGRGTNPVVIEVPNVAAGTTAIAAIEGAERRLDQEVAAQLQGAAPYLTTSADAYQAHADAQTFLAARGARLLDLIRGEVATQEQPPESIAGAAKTPILVALWVFIAVYAYEILRRKYRRYRD